MSLAIAAVDNNRELWICADKRAIRGESFIDDFPKVFAIAPNIYFAMTGIVEEGIKVLQIVKDALCDEEERVISAFDSAMQPSSMELTVMLAGKCRSGGYFIWSKNQSGFIERLKPDPRMLVFSIAGIGDERVKPYFIEAYMSRIGLEAAMRKTIEYASSIHYSVSPVCDLYKM